MDSVTVTIPIPDRRVSPNVMAHWRTKYRHKKEQRKAAWLAALDAQGGNVRKWEKATVEVKWYGRTPSVLKMDADNLIASLKGSADGLADAGLIVNDRGLRWADPVTAVDKANPRVELVVTKADSGVEA